MNSWKKPVIAGNWKMHKTIAEAISLAKAIVSGAGNVQKASLILIPPFTAIMKSKKC